MAIDIDRLKAALADRYAVEREVGRGGMAVVYLAEDLKHHRNVAIKVLRPELAASLGAERFLREIETAAKLNHPHILPLHNSGSADGYVYYVMPYVEGESLRQRLDRETQLPIDEAIDIADQLAEALDYAHNHDVMHRDIKPANILLSEGQAIVTDFGIARAISSAGGERLTATGLAVGSPSYMSPEQAAGERLDGRSDIYSLGCVVYEMLVGDPPFVGRSQQAVIARHSAAAVPSAAAARDTVPVLVDRAVQRAMAKLPADRYRVASSFATALRQPTGVLSEGPKLKSRLAESPASIIGAALIIAVLVSIAVFALELVPKSNESVALMSLPPYLAAWVTTMIGTWFLFEKAEETVTSETRQSVTRWLRNLDPASAVQTWPASFAKIFDRVFSERHLSWKCFRRSCLASFSAVVIVALLWTALTPHGIDTLTSESGPAIAVILILTTLLNFTADYFSLLETRYVLARMSRARHTARVAALIAVDIVATIVIWLLVLLLITAMMWLVDGIVRGVWHVALPEGSWAYKLKMLPIWLWLLFRVFAENTLLPGSEQSWVQIWFLSTFVTSVWLWLYALAGSAVRLAPLLGVGVGTAQRALDIEYKPIRSVGFVAMLLVSLLFAAALAIHVL